MPTITVLDQATINQIAAGEVIERPSSVVKELLENSIDAGATAVTVEIKEGGISMIRITDNGCGIEKDQIRTAFLRHSTSKIKTAADLLTVSSLGFRGEALSSIAAVAQVELITKTPEELTGSRYQIFGGKEVSFEEIGAPEGTTFLVRNLFYNVPARRKFLKTPQTEGSYISSLMEKMALSRPDLSFRFIVNNQNKLHSSGNHNLKDLIYMIYGREIAMQLLPVYKENGFMKISGFIGKPVISRGNRAYENYFINGRYIRSNLICKAIEDGFHSYMMQHKYPFTVLHIEIEPEYLDVNVHPSKMELRFRNQEDIYQTIYDAIRESLSGKELIRKVTPSPEKEVKKEAAAHQNDMVNALKGMKRPEPFERKRLEAEREEEKKSSVKNPGFSTFFPRVEAPSYVKENKTPFPVKTEQLKKAPVKEEAEKPVIVPQTAEPVKPSAPEEPIKIEEQAKPVIAPKQMELFDQEVFTKEARKDYQFIGQLFDTYWLIQYQDEFLIIDQHAAHEKIIYERMVKERKEKKIYSQNINPPMIVTMNLREEEILQKYRKRFEELGFEIEHFGGKEYAIYAVPQNLYGISEKDFFLELLDSLSEDLSKESEEMILEKIASMSCKAAVKGGDRLSVQEAKALIDELLLLENPYACPHGRPTIISMSKREIEKKFKRIV